MTLFEEYRQRTENMFNFAIDANQSYMVLTTIRKEQEEHNDIINLSPAFYSSVYYSCLQSVVLDVCKMFDGERKKPTESTRILLEDIKMNSKQFEDRSISVIQYKKITGVFSNGSYYHESFDTVDRVAEHYLKLIKSKKEKAIIDSLKCLRNKYYAHLDFDTQNNIVGFFQSHSVSLADIEELLTLNSNICTTLYRYYLDTDTYPLAINYNDFSRTIRCIEKYSELSEKFNDYY